MKAALLALACCSSPPEASPPTRQRRSSSSPAPRATAPASTSTRRACRLLAHCINTSPNLKGFKAEVITDGWPKDEKAFDDAATVLLFSDGSDRDEKAHPLLRDSAWPRWRS